MKLRKEAKKLSVAFGLGLFILVGYSLMRGVVVYVHHAPPDEQVPRGGSANPAPPPPAVPLTAHDEVSAPGTSHTGWRSWIPKLVVGASQLFRDYTMPHDPSRQVLFIALSVSVFCAFVLNCYFPEEYRSLDAKEIHIASIQAAIPTLQILAAALAICTLESFWWHTGATGAYFLLFVAWDWLIHKAEARDEVGRKFKKQVAEYATRIDGPAVVALVVVVVMVAWFRGRLERVGRDTLVAGVLLAQACAAAFGLGVVVRLDWKAGADGRSEKKGSEVGGAPAASKGSEVGAESVVEPSTERPG